MEYYKELGLEPIHYYCEFEQDFKIEEFRAVKGYEGLYEVSDLGRVKSLAREVANNFKGFILLPEIILKLGRGTGGYLGVGLSNKGKVKTYQVHQLVSVAFLGHKPNGTKSVVNHKNFNRAYNVKTNLEIVSPRKNTDKKHLPSSSSFVGVSFISSRNRWRARIYIDGKRIHLGHFRNEIDAGKAYDTALNEYQLL